MSGDSWTRCGAGGGNTAKRRKETNVTPELAARLEVLRLSELDGGSLDVAHEIEALLECDAGQSSDAAVDCPHAGRCWGTS